MLSRRHFALSVLTGAASTAPLTALAASPRRIPQRASARVIVDNDFAGDPDGLLALAHQVLTPKTRTVLVTSSALNAKLMGNAPAGSSARLGRDLALELFQQARITSVPPVLAGAETLDRPDAEPSAAALAIVAEALREDPLPLYFTCGGPLTNLAAALRLEPRIAARMTVIWIGGGPYPEGGWEYNLSSDLSAARTVIEQSAIPIWQIPQQVYRQMQVSIAELTARLQPASPFGAWLYERFTSPPDFVDLGGSWPMGDSPTVLLSAIAQESSRFTDRPAQRLEDDSRYGAPLPGRTIRVFDQIDARLAIEDFFALLRLHADGRLRD